ncbi:MAG: hypothetical protein ABWZ99_06020 [Ilumatobacteraceae bacterium]
MSAPGQMPVIVGVAQVVQRPGEVALEEARGPIELMVDAARLAERDAGASSLLTRADFVGVAGGWFRYQNPGQLIAAEVGCPDAATALTAISGTAPQDLVGLASERIAAGTLDVAIIVGGEARWSHQRLSRSGVPLPWIVDPGTGTPESLSGFPDHVRTEHEVFGGAPAAYAVFEDRVRTTLGETLEAHRTRIADLWADFSKVAADNPHAWDRTPHTPEAIREPSSENRMIAFPYTKAMVANNTVDMATALILCTVDAAIAAGVARDRMVFPLVVTSGHETWLLSERRELDGSPALTAAAHAAFLHAGLGVDDVDHIDLYACFPSIVEMSVGSARSRPRPTADRHRRPRLRRRARRQRGGPFDRSDGRPGTKRWDRTRARQRWPGHQTLLRALRDLSPGDVCPHRRTADRRPAPARQPRPGVRGAGRGRSGHAGPRP